MKLLARVVALGTAVAGAGASMVTDNWWWSAAGAVTCAFVLVAFEKLTGKDALKDA